MSSVKITDLPQVLSINANTANTVLVGVDIPTNITGQITLTTLARGLYSNNNLVVGNNFTVLPNVVGQFTGNSATYLQVNLENQTAEGSGDFVVTANDGSDTDFYIDLGMNGSAYSDPAYSATGAHDGYLYVAASGAGKGNLVIGTTNTTGRVNFVVGGLESENIVGYIDSTGIWSGAINSVVSANAASANSVINTRISANVATLRGEITANTDSTLLAINSRITSNISTANLFTQAAFNKANSALANTSGTFNGDLNVRGNIVAFSIATSNITSFVSDVTPASNALVEIVGSLGGVQQTPSNDGYMLHITNKPNLPSRIVSDAFGSINNYTVIAGRSARGTATTPTATQNNDVLMRITGNGWGTTGFAPLGTGRIDFIATENYTDTARGSKIVFYNTVNASNVINQIASFNADSVTFVGVVNPEKGFIYTPRTFAGAQTAITIDFANNVVLKANCAADITFSFSNYTPGKQVEVWLTNTSGSNRTVTHGCSATNSTDNGTTFVLPATSTAWLKYFCVDGDLANTYVTSTHA
jgi:hypothetical protein